MPSIAITYTPDDAALVVTAGRRHLVIVPAYGWPIQPQPVDAIAGEVGKSIWVAYPSQRGLDGLVYLLIVIVDAKRGRHVAPVLVSEPLTRGIAFDQLALARAASDPLDHLQSDLRFTTGSER